MLSVQLKSGEYLTIGEDIVVQVYQVGRDFHVAVEAPREVPIIRGEVLERTGQRPACIRELDPRDQRKGKRGRKKGFKRSAQAG